MTGKNSRSFSLLLELTAAIALFAVAAAICTRVLVSARNMSLEARELNRAVRTVSSAAELLRAGEEELALDLEEQLVLRRREDRGIVYYRIEYIREGRVLYALDTALGEEAAP